jgi:hypothetical protein
VSSSQSERYRTIRPFNFNDISKLLHGSIQIAGAILLTTNGFWLKPYIGLMLFKVINYQRNLLEKEVFLFEADHPLHTLFGYL